jgi:chemotaxis protein histidine kinase CheA
MEGAGLGLSIAEWIVGQHRGSIEVQSSPGRGSVFQVELPVPFSRFKALFLFDLAVLGKALLKSVRIVHENV